MARAGGWHAAGWRIVAIAAFVAAPALAETRALLVGVSKYRSAAVPDLAGPITDLVAMEALANKAGATDVHVLADGQVSRSSVEAALHAMGRRARPGDWILFYYSGHGAQAQAGVKGTSDGDFDQFVPLPGFDPSRQDSERFIVDKDFYAWLSRYVPADVQILMVADTCHSGTLNRAVDPRAFHFTRRLALRDGDAAVRLIARPGPRFPAVAPGAGATADRADLANLIFIGAAQDGQLALEAEMPVDGQPMRGVLTWSFENAFTTMDEKGARLLADLDGNGRLSVVELASYLDSEVRALTDERQQPRLSYGTGAARIDLFAGISGSALERARRTVASLYVADGGGGFDTADLPWRRAAAPEDADFVFAAKEGALVRRSGDVVARGIETAAALRSVAEKWTVIEDLRPYLNEAAARVEVAPLAPGTLYAPGSTVKVDLRQNGAGPAFATVFNLAANGTVQLLFPLVPEDKAGQIDRAGALPLFESRVVPPYGVDHVVALVTTTPPLGLHALLKRVDNQRAADRVLAPLKAALLAEPGRASLSIAAIRTGF